MFSLVTYVFLDCSYVQDTSESNRVDTWSYIYLLISNENANGFNILNLKIITYFLFTLILICWLHQTVLLYIFLPAMIL